MNKPTIIIAIVMLLLTSLSATAMDDVVVVKDLNWWSYLTGTQYTITGVYLPTNIVRGDTVPLTFDAKWQYDSSRTIFSVNIVDSNSITVLNKVGEFSYNQPTVVDDWKKLTIGSFNTLAIPESYCGKQIYVWIVQYDYTSNGLVEDKRFASDGKQLFTLDCQADNPCQEHWLNQPICKYGISTLTYDTKVFSDCSERVVSKDACDTTEKCSEGACVARTPPPPVCPDVTCDYGYAMDTQGCKICNPAPEPVNDTPTCKAGFYNATTGTCTFYPTPTNVTCEKGFQRSLKGGCEPIPQDFLTTYLPYIAIVAIGIIVGLFIMLMKPKKRGKK